MTDHFEIKFDFPTWKIHWLPFSLINLNYSNDLKYYPLITYHKNLIDSNYNVYRLMFRTHIFCRGKIYFPNDVDYLFSRFEFKFSQSKIKQISTRKTIPPAIVSVRSMYNYDGFFSDGLINVAAAAYRGDKYAMIYAPYDTKTVLIEAEQIPSNFS